MNGKPDYFQIYENSKPFADYKMWIPYLLLPLKPATSKRAIVFQLCILKNFFGIQYARRLHLNKIPIKNVNHPLDEKIPFTPEKISVYTDFVGFFMRIFHFMMKTLPRKQANRLSNQFFTYLQSLYSQAGKIYQVSLSTTKRPFYIKSSRFLIIHLFDPHYMCIPSLHVAIVCCTYAFLRHIFQTEQIPISEEQKKTFLQEVYSGSLSITESVLFVKQHSINCLAAAFYMTSVILPQNFWTPQDCKLFIQDLFAFDDLIQKDDLVAIKSHIQNLYDSLINEHQNTVAVAKEDTFIDWREPLLKWLSAYSNQ